MRKADAYLAIFDTQYVVTRIEEPSEQIDSELKEASDAGLAIAMLIMEPTKSTLRRVADELDRKAEEFPNAVGTRCPHGSLPLG
jgi:shikimate 5-dehydrogenase